MSHPHGSTTERTGATHLLLASDSDDERAHQGDSDVGSDSLFQLQVPQPHSVPAASDANAEPALDQRGPQPGVEPAMQQSQAEAAGVQEAAAGEPAAPPGQQQQQQGLARTSTRLEHRSGASPLGQIREGEALQETASQRLHSAGGTEAAEAGPSTSGALTLGNRTLSGASAGSPSGSTGDSLEAGLESGGPVWHDSAGSSPPDRMSRDGFEQYIKSRLAGQGRASMLSPCCLSRTGQQQLHVGCLVQQELVSCTGAQQHLPGACFCPCHKGLCLGCSCGMQAAAVAASRAACGLRTFRTIYHVDSAARNDSYLDRGVGCPCRHSWGHCVSASGQP